MKPGIYQTPGNPVHWERRPYSDRGRSRITPDDVRRDLAALADMIGNGFDIARVFGTWVFPQTNREGQR